MKPPSHIDQMPTPIHAMFMKPKPVDLPTFGDRQHVWGWHMPMDEQAKCWCEPFVVPIGTPFTGGHVYHRPEYGTVMWEHGEQGPMTARQMAFERSQS